MRQHRRSLKRCDMEVAWLLVLFFCLVPCGGRMLLFQLYGFFRKDVIAYSSEEGHNIIWARQAHLRVFTDIMRSPQEGMGSWGFGVLE